MNISPSVYAVLLVFHAFDIPYFLPLFYPAAGISAVIVEVVVFWLLNRHLAIGKIIAIVLLASLLSGFAGSLLLGLFPGFFPSGLVNFSPGPRFKSYMVLGFFFAYAVRLVTEYAIVRKLAGWAKVTDPCLTVTLANLTSYAALIVVAWWFWMTFRIGLHPGFMGFNA
ncbi:MAG: hypothetical protein ABSF26_23370 [Thermoguttaceae bacterium]